MLRAYVLFTQVSAPPLCVLEPRGLLPAEPIVDVLKYSQKDLDAVVRPGSCFVKLATQTAYRSFLYSSMCPKDQ
jgi:hypothetical protein